MNNNKFDEIISLAHTTTKTKFLKTLKCFDDYYYNSGTELLSDAQYDTFKQIYENRFGKYKVTGAPIKAAKNKVKLPYWLGSMDKAYPSDEKFLNNWIKKYSGPYKIEGKEDGVSGLLIIEKNGNRSLFTRGNGLEGTDISHLTDYLNGIPEKINWKKVGGSMLAVRGEIIIKNKVFEKFFSTTAKNPRSLISGLVNAKTFNEEVAINTDYVCYEIIEPSKMTASEQINFLNSLGFITPYNKNIKKISVSILEKNLKLFKENSDYELDGIIIIDDNYHQRNTADNPKYAFAFKKNIEIVDAKVKRVIWDITRYGVIKPKIEISPINLQGVEITFATAHNANFIEKNKIGPGTLIKITRSGGVIPYIVNIEKSTYAQMPNVKYEWDKNHTDILDISEQNEGKIDIEIILHFFQKIKAKGIAKKTIEKLYEAGYYTIKSILDITEEELIEIGFGERQSENIFKVIEKGKINIPLGLLMAATPFFDLGLGERRMAKIIKDIPNILSKKENKSLENEIANIEGWSQTSAEQFVKGLVPFKNFIKENPELTYSLPKINKSGKFAGMKILFTGFRDDEWKKIIESQGGSVVTSVSANTDLLVTKDIDSTQSKIEKARTLGVKIVSKDNFAKNF